MKTGLLFLTIPTLARRLDLGDATVRRCIANGSLVPDCEVDLGARKGRMPIFAGDRLEEIRAALLPSPATEIEV